MTMTEHPLSESNRDMLGMDFSSAKPAGQLEHHIALGDSVEVFNIHDQLPAVSPHPKVSSISTVGHGISMETQGGKRIIGRLHQP